MKKSATKLLTKITTFILCRARQCTGKHHRYHPWY